MLCACPSEQAVRTEPPAQAAAAVWVVWPPNCMFRLSIKDWIQAARDEYEYEYRTVIRPGWAKQLSYIPTRINSAGALLAGRGQYSTVKNGTRMMRY